MIENEQTIITGFGAIPVPTYVFIAEAVDAETNTKVPWYTMDYSNKEDPRVAGIFEPGFTGELKGIRVVEKEWKNEPVFKFDFMFKADTEKFVFRLGRDSLCARSMVLAFNTYIRDYGTLADEIVTMQVQNADEENVIFFNLFDAASGDRVRVEYDKECKLSPLVDAINKSVGYDPNAYNKPTNANQQSAEENSSEDESDAVSRVIAKTSKAKSTKATKSTKSATSTKSKKSKKEEPLMDDDEKAEILNSVDSLLEDDGKSDNDY